jgi:small subunit ribosomal protein S16
MAVKIRLSRVGRHKRPIYRIVVADSNKARNGKVIDILGTYDPLDSVIKYDAENAVRWIKQGAVATDTVRTIFNKSQLYKQVGTPTSVTTPIQAEVK